MSTIKSKEDLAYAVNTDDLIPLVNYDGDIPKSVANGGTGLTITETSNKA